MNSAPHQGSPRERSPLPTAQSVFTSRLDDVPLASQRRRIGFGVMGAIASIVLLLALMGLFLLDFGVERPSRPLAIALISGCLLIVACLALLLGRLGRDYEKAVAQLGELNRGLQDENANHRVAEVQNQRIVRGLRAIVEATDELIAIGDETRLLERAIDLGREKLDLERCRLFLVAPGGSSLQATFGTSDRGTTRDERTAPVQIQSPWQDDPHVPSLDERWRLMQSQPLWYWENGQWQTLRHQSWIAATLVLADKEPLGVFYHDTAFSGAPHDFVQQQLVSVYCSLLGALIGRQRTQAHLLEIQNHLQVVMQNAPLFLYSVDANEVFTLAMGEALSLVNLSPDRMLGQRITEALPPGDLSIGRIRGALKGETTYTTFEYANRHLQVFRQPTLDADGSISGMIGIGVDITERIEAEQLLQASRARYRNVVNSLKEVVFQTDAKGHWTFLNPSWTEILGWSEAESLGQPFANFISPDDRPLLDEELASLVTRQKEFTRHTMRYLTKEGDVRWLEVFARLLVDENGNMVGTSGTLNDVTERHRAEEQLQATTALQNAILGGVNYAIIACDASGTIQLFNRAAETMLGYAALDVVGTSADELVKQIQDPHELATRARLLGQECGELLRPGLEASTFKARRGLREEQDWTFVRRDESRFPGRLSVSALRDEKGEVTGFVGIISDLSESRRIERLKNEFVSVVSHELRTPLTSIRGSLGLLEGGVVGQMPPAAAQMIGIAQKNVERLVVLINDILDIEKIESGKMRFEMSELSLEDLLRSACEQNLTYGEALGVGLKLETLPSSLEGRLICGDEGRLMQVLSNLISNAMKYTPAQGVVTLQATPGDDEWVRIEVRDQGTGVPEEFVPYLFERFAQAEQTSTRKQGGTGLGLAIAKAIIEKHSGRMGYLPPAAEGLGSTFYFDLELLPPGDIPLTPPTVLVCEDDPDVAELLTVVLESEGYRARVATTLAATRELLASGAPFAALLLDLVLPDGNGLDLMAELSEETQARQMPIIVVSAHCESGKLHGEAFRVSDWIAKPLDTGRILHAVSELSGRQGATGKPRLLHVEDDADVRQIIQLMIGESADVVSATNLAEAREQLSSQHFDLALLDIGLPDGSGLSLVPLLSAQEPPVPVVLFSAREEGENQSGVLASLTKSRTTNAELRATIERLLPHAG